MSTRTPPTPPAPRPRPPKRKGPSPITVITGTLGTFFIVLTLLAFQVRAGKDPSLSKAPASASSSSSSATSGQVVPTAAAKKATKAVVTKSS